MLLAFALSAAAAPLVAQEVVPDTTGPVVGSADTTGVPRIVLRLRVDSVPLRLPLALQPGGRLGARVPPAVVAARWERSTGARIAGSREQRRSWPSPLQFAEAEVPTAPPPLPPFARRPVTPVAPEGPAPLEALARYADLGLQLRSRFEMKVDQLRNRRCTSADLLNPVSGCQSGFPTPALDQQFNVRAGGIVGDRVHVNVDYDSEREFTANNNINVYYQGLEDEILRRVEVGNVGFVAPASRFITAAIPANSFGIQAEAQIGAFEFRTILAQQRGSQLRTRVYTVGERTTQPVSRELRDLDFETGRFFSVVNPRAVPGFPDVDLLGLAADALPATQRPVQVRVYRLRARSATSVTNPNLGGIDAVALRTDSPQRVGPFPWELLVEGRDYYLDPSGLWFALGTRVGDQDFLAVSYVTATGDTVGTYPALNRGLDTLELIYEPRRGTEVPTFDYELRNVYRLGSSDIDRSSLDVALVVNESERPLDGLGTYLSRLRVAQPSDEARLDEFNRVFPRDRDPNNGAPVVDLFLVFPHFRPFADTVRLQAAERNDSLYRTPTYLLSTQGPPPRFRVRLQYEAAGGGDRGSLNLGALQIRDGTEKLFIGTAQLVRGRHYTIEYAIGQITFINPDSLFRGPTQVRAQFEENQLFDVAPKSLYGITTTYNLGSRGRINAILLSQKESSLLTRPQLGFEPQANLLGGLSTELYFRPDIVTRALDALPLISTSVPSNLTVTGEIAMSKPNPNQAGEAYLEEFEGASTRGISLLENQWQLGSRPASARGLGIPYLAPTGGFADADAVPLVWQNAVQSGNDVLQFGPRDIDSTIILLGTAREIETVLWLTLKPDTIGGAPNPLTGAPRWFRPHTPGPRWRSMTQPFGGTGLGLDLSRVEFLEFWVLEDAERSAKTEGVTMLVDFGTVFEDAVAFGPDSFTVAGTDTVFSGFRFVGQGRLDTERDTLTNVFNAALNDVGIHGDLLPTIVNATTGAPLTNFPTCALVPGAGLPVFPLGDIGARCTRRNGFADGEDLNGDGRLDVTVGTVGEDLVRYVFPVGDDRYFVRNGNTLVDARGRPVTWRLYRIPFREDTLQIGSPNLRQIQAMRLTVVAPDRGPQEPEVFFALTRMKLVGAPWLKRAATPIAGLSGAQGEPHGEVIASLATTENLDLGYTPPPGVLNQADRRGAGFEFGSQQINEKSLRLLARDLRGGERAEAFIRFTDEADKNFLRYGTLRVWARGRGPGWEDGDLEFFIKAGRDEHNFYLYRTPVRTVDWLPEVVIDLDRWLLLRADIEGRWLRGEPPSGSAECGGDLTAYVACDGPYMVQVRDPGIAPPNLARVSELAVGIYRSRQSVFVDQAEVWVDDIRLSDVNDRIGVAGAIDVRLQAADVGDFAFSFSTRDAQFQQLGEAPSYTTDGAIRLGGTFRLDKLLPGSNFSIPLGIQYTRSTVDPFYLNRSDIRADALTGLREPRSATTSYTIGYRKTSRGTSLVERLFVDPLSLQGSLFRAQTTTELSEATSTNRQLRVDYNNVPTAVTVKGAPGFLVNLVNGLPTFVRTSEFAKALRGARLRVTPAQVRGAVTLTNNETSRFTYRVPVVLASDAALLPSRGITHTLRSDGGLDLRPFPTLSLRTDISSTRDLQDYGDTTAIGRLLQRERRDLLGAGVGFERQRIITTALNVSPAIASWLRPRFLLTTRFTFNRDPNQRTPVRLDGDTAGAFRLPETLANTRRRELGLTVAPGRLLANLVGERTALGRAFLRIQPVDVAWSRELRSSFDRPPFGAPLGYQFALGGLESFRAREGVLATSAGDQRSRTAGGGVQLPLGLSARANYREQEAFTWSARGGATEQTELVQRSTEWPSGSVSWTYSPRWGLRKVVSIVNANVRYVENETSSEQPGLAGGEASSTASTSRAVGPSLTLTWVGGIVTTFQLNDAQTNAITSGNTTRRDQDDWTATVNFAFRPPRSLIRLRNEIRSTLSYTSSAVVVCLLRAGSDECTPISDSRRSALDIRLDTGFSPQVRGGANFSYVVTEQRHTSQEFAQMVFSVFAEVFFLSGQLR
ncbi:MAG: cell surface protein SprA [Gemmatimonadota bacterium]|nr:cell surface protein SprA [Gemmatimonadota bacterium]